MEDLRYCALILSRYDRLRLLHVPSNLVSVIRECVNKQVGFLSFYGFNGEKKILNSYFCVLIGWRTKTWMMCIICKVCNQILILFFHCSGTYNYWKQKTTMGLLSLSWVVVPGGQTAMMLWKLAISSPPWWARSSPMGGRCVAL